MNIRHWIRHPRSTLTCTDNKNSFLTEVPASNPNASVAQAFKTFTVKVKNVCKGEEQENYQLLRRRSLEVNFSSYVTAIFYHRSFNRSEDRMSTSVQHMSSEKWPWWRELSDAKIHRWTLHTVHPACNCLSLHWNMLNFFDILFLRQESHVFLVIFTYCTKLAGIFLGL